MAQFLIHAIVAGNGWTEIGALSIVVKRDETVQGFGMSDSAEEGVPDSGAPCAVQPTIYILMLCISLGAADMLCSTAGCQQGLSGQESTGFNISSQ